MKSVAALCASLLCACSLSAPPTLLPPPFGPDPDRPEPARFFFPTGIAIDPSGTWVVVSNSNADRLYDAGAMYSLRAADLKTLVGLVPFPTASLAGAAITGNYTGPMVLGSAPLTSYTASRDTNRLNAVAIDPSNGALSCRGGTGIPGGGQDCRGDSIDLNRAVKLEGPFGMAVGKIRPPGAIADVDAVMVSSLVPHVDDIQSGLVLSSSSVAVLAQSDPMQPLFAAIVTDRVNGLGVGAGPMVFDDRTREVILSGCFSRFGSASAGGELSTLKCGFTAGTTNLLRFVPMDAGSSATARLYDLGQQIHSTDTTGLALGDVDTVTGLRRLYLTTRNPDTVVRVALAADPAFGPVVEAVVTISSQPSQVVILRRPAGSTGPDLLAVTGVATYETSTAAGKLVLVDGGLGRVVGQVDDIGDTPYAIAQFPPLSGDTSAHLAVTLFGGCSVSLIDVPFDAPGSASLRARIGSCPQ
jgi:hypothetical protein